MIFILPIAFYFIASVSCLPFFTSYKNFFSRECTNFIQQELDLYQGLKPDMTNTANFGYIYRLDTPTISLGPDISIIQSQKTELLPSQAAVVLSSLTFDETNSKLVIRGRISKLNSDRLTRVSSQEGSSMKIRFNIFGMEQEQQQWYSKLGSAGDITGTVNSINVIQQKDEDKTYRELIIELTPEENSENLQYIEYNNSPTSMKQIVWSGPSALKNPCKANRRDRIHEIIDSAVLL